MKVSRRAVLPAFSIPLLLLALFLGGPDNRFDVATIQDLATIRAGSPGLTQAAIMLTNAGSAYATIGLGLIAALWLAYSGERPRALLLAAAIATERVLADGMKAIVNRPRPSFDVHPVVTNSSAFPSGHAANSMAVFAMVALIAVPPPYRRRAMIAAVLLSLTVGATRPFLGVHWPSDVIGGWSLGMLAAWAALRIGERLGVLPVEPQHQIVGGHGAAIDQR